MSQFYSITEDEQKLFEKAKQRILFFYANQFQDDSKAEKLKNILDKIIFRFIDKEHEEAFAYYNNENEIFLCNPFYNLTEEEKIEVLIHELNHAISDNNIYNKLIYDSEYNYVNSLKIIEEGLADVVSELINEYYYEKNGKSQNIVNNNNFFPCGYPYDRQILKMFLYILKQKNLDIKLLINYYFEDRKTFMDKLVEIGGIEILEYLKISKEVNNDLSQKLLVSIDKNFIKNIDIKELSHQFYVNKNGYDFVYSKDNGHNNIYLYNLLLHYCIKNILGENFEYSVQNLEYVYNQTNGLIGQITNGGYCPVELEMFLDSAMAQYNINVLEKLLMIVPNILTILDGKYINYVADILKINTSNLDEYSNMIFKLFKENSVTAFSLLIDPKSMPEEKYYKYLEDLNNLSELENSSKKNR